MGVGSGGGGSGLAGVAGAVLAAELMAPLLLLCGLCCWPDDNTSDSSSTTGKHPQKPVVTQESSHRRRRSSEVFSRRPGSSTVSLHLPSTSGHSKQPLAAHRSHEEIPSRRRSHSHLSPEEEDARYHSAPSVIDEVIHRRDWERSSKELYIPLKPDVSELFNDRDSDISSLAAPQAESESSSVECLQNAEPTVLCKKHYTNIKSSRNRTKKESIQNDVKDTDATENQSRSTTSDFYIGDHRNETSILKESQLDKTNIEMPEEKIKSVYKAKDAKQTFNESIKLKEHPHIKYDDEGIDSPPWEGYKVKMVDMDMDLCIDELDRSGAIHHDASRTSLITCVSRTGALPPPSVEAVGWEGGACYLSEAGSLRSRARLLAAEGGAGIRARHASDGDILAPTLRPESGAFSESDLELELEASEELPPSYEELSRTPCKETAI